EIEFIKQGSFTAEELNAFVCVLKIDSYYGFLIPMLDNMLEDGGKTPILTPLELEDIGYKVVACHLSLMGYPSMQWRCSSPPSMNISHDYFELTVAKTPNYNEPLNVKKEPINEACSTNVESLLFYSDRLEIQHIEASMNSKPPQNVVSSSSALANSSAFVRPSRTPTSTRFGSALNIETLVAAAKREETPIDETIKEVYTSVLTKRFTHPVNIPKPPQNVVSCSSALANSLAFVHPSRTPTSTRFDSALNIETLVAAAKREETPIDETIKEVYTSVLTKRFTHPVNIPNPPQNVVSSSSALANSPAFVRPSQTPTSTRFGSALNIETLVAAAKREETPIDETIKGNSGVVVPSCSSGSGVVIGTKKEVTEEELDALLDDSKPFLGTSKNISESSRDHELEEFMAIKIVEKPEQEEEVKDNLRKFKDQEFYPRPTNRSCDETSSQTSRISFAGKRFLSSSSHIRSTQRR
nr:CCR4-Not transcription complex subunit 1-like [Tanacetum cinerariifolium]